MVVPARNEEEVIQHTIDGVLRANYPLALMEVVVICRIDDGGTITKVQEKIVELVARGISRNEIGITAFGESRPLVPTADGVREPQNRRVEIKYGPGSGM